MPVYNVAPFVRGAVESVLSQSFADLELIVVDDGSTDGTAREIAKIDDPRIALIHIEHRGVWRARTGVLGTLMGGGMESCRGVENRRSLDADSTRRPIFNRRQVTNLPHNRYVAFLDGDDLWTPGVL